MTDRRRTTVSLETNPPYTGVRDYASHLAGNVKTLNTGNPTTQNKTQPVLLIAGSRFV